MSAVERPVIDDGEVEKLLQNVYGLNTLSIEELKSHSDRNFHVVVATAPMHANDASGTKSHMCPHLVPGSKSEMDITCREEFVFKVTTDFGGAESEKLFCAQSKLLIHLERHGFTAPIIKSTLSGRLFEKTTSSSSSLVCALYTYIPGKVLYNFQPLSAFALQHAGKIVAQFRIAVKNFDPQWMNYYKGQEGCQEWTLTSIPSLVQYTHLLKDCEKSLVHQVVDQYQKQVAPHVDTLPKGLIHGDFHDENLLVLNGQDDRLFTKDKNHSHTTTPMTDSCKMLGILDFMDCYYSCCVFDVACVIAFSMLGDTQGDLVPCGGHVLAGYMELYPLTAHERQVLFSCVCAAFCVELVLCSRDDKAQAGQNHYLQSSLKNGWTQLAKLLDMGEKEVTDVWWEMVDQQNMLRAKT